MAVPAPGSGFADQRLHRTQPVMVQDAYAPARGGRPAPVLPVKDPPLPVAPVAPADPMPMPLPPPPPAPERVPPAPTSNGALSPGGQRASGDHHGSAGAVLPLGTLVAVLDLPTVGSTVRPDTSSAGWIVGGQDDPVLRPD
jgi:hypothetical protein